MSNLPAGLFVEAVLRNCDLASIPYYIVQKGNHGSGVIMVKVSMLDGYAKLHTQQRNFMTDALEWISVFDPDELVEEKRADAHLQKAKEFDPDLWIIEIEDRAGKNPFKDL